uniref:Uncharacterized protein n=1 Tax=Chenopodium quinoa TaxID=63459 RepID=A0A803KQV8_CHEQI
MMGRLSVIMRNNLIFLSRRTYASAASDGIRIIASNGPVLKNKASDASEKVIGNNFPITNKQLREVFWMRDPTTGFWMPENHFDEVDVAELRQKLLYNKQG